ncbi:MAG: FAD-dependent oxidoreductase [Bacillota bacterium]|nr:FAD-dependent oxidoreductase [Bacillota bacterium]
MKDKLIRLGIFLVCMFCVYQFGLKPMIKKDTSIKTTSGNFGWAKKDLIRESDKYDVIVFGEEPEGIAAAVTAARAGAKTLLVATGNDLGGSICGSLDFNFEPDIGINNEVLNRGIFTEIISALGNEISPQKYKSVMEKLVKSVNNLEVIYGASLKSPAVDNNIIYGINLVVDGKEGSYFGKRFIDASKYGELLVKCKAPCFKGAEDINLKNVYAPVSINFEISNIKWSEVEDSLSQDKIERLKGALSAYKPVNANFRLGKIKFINEGDGKIIVHGLEAFNVNVADDKALMDQYYIATEEAKTFAKFLKDRLIPFQNSVYEKTADKFSIKEYRHFKGEHILTVNEALQNTDFIDKVAVASNPIEAYSSDDTNEKYIIGKPLQYSIPLGCIIPLEIDNLFMIGSKISYSSLVSSSSASIGSNITVGESSGIAAVYSLVKNELPRTFVKGIGSKK